MVLDEYGPNRMIRSKEFKYIKRYPYGPDEMYDLVNDPDERNNLLLQDNHSKKTTELRYELEVWFNKYVNPEIDGAKEAVYGSGQINLAHGAPALAGDGGRLEFADDPPADLQHEIADRKSVV